MKFNQWTLGLAALGVVSLASVARAEEKMSAIQAAMSSTTISGYVDTSAQWNAGTGNANNPPYKFGGASKADGFNLNVVQLTIAKPLDEAEWAAGYRADLWFGPDANTLRTLSTDGWASGDFAIRQAYVALRMPIGNGLDWKLGVFDSIIGYESVEDGNNPNHTRSYGHSIEPQTHTGILATYRFNDNISVSAGAANTVNSAINSRAHNASGTSAISFGGMDPGGVFGVALRNLYSKMKSGAHDYRSSVIDKIDAAYDDGAIDDDTYDDIYDAATEFRSDVLGIPFNQGTRAKAESYKAYMGSVTLTAPESWGSLKGSSLYGGVVNGFNNSGPGTGFAANQTSWYVGATVATPVTGLRVGGAFDYLNVADIPLSLTSANAKLDLSAWAVAGYASYQATEKLSLHLRGEYLEAEAKAKGSVAGLDVLDAAGNIVDVDAAHPATITSIRATTVPFSLSDQTKIVAVTATVQYDLWKNVITRLEFRWDHSATGEDMFGVGSTGSPDRKNAYMIAANVIYKF